MYLIEKKMRTVGKSFEWFIFKNLSQDNTNIFT